MEHLRKPDLFFLPWQNRCFFSQLRPGQAVGTMSSVLTKNSVIYTRTESVLILCGAHICSPLLKSCPLCKGHLQRQCLDPLVPGSQGSLCCDSEQS